jgi:hypothetical protein
MKRVAYKTLNPVAKTWFVVSANECSDSAIIPDEPVITAAINLRTVISPFAKSVPSTASIERTFGKELLLRLDYRGKQSE